MSVVPGEEHDIRGAKCKATSGSYNVPSSDQNRRMYDLGKLVREHRKLLEAVMMFDPHHAKDDRGTPYWGSKRHIIASALRLLDREIENALRGVRK